MILLEESGFDAFSLIIFSSKSWRAAKPSANALMFWPVHIDINLPYLSGMKRKFREIYMFIFIAK